MAKAPRMGTCDELDCRPEDVLEMKKRANVLRGPRRKTKANPHYPDLPCAYEGCNEVAVEGYYFCSLPCRVYYNRDH